MKLNVQIFALTCSIFWGLGLLTITWWIILLDGVQDGPTALGALYRGYTFTPFGSLVGFAWAIADGYIGGAIFAWLYNKLLGRKDKQAV